MSTRLDRKSALELTREINKGGINWKAVDQAYRYSIHFSLGYVSWLEYCRKALKPEPRPRYRVSRGTPEFEVRRQNFSNLREQGMDLKSIAAAYGISQSVISAMLVGRRSSSSKDMKFGHTGQRIALSKQLARPVADLASASRRIVRAIDTSPEALRHNREVLRNLYLTELRLATEQLETVIEKLQK